MKTAAFSASASGYRKEQYMLNVGKIEEGFVLDHIKAGNAMKIYHYLGLDKLDCTVAIIKKLWKSGKFLCRKKSAASSAARIPAASLLSSLLFRTFSILQMRRRKSTAAGTATSGMKPMIRANYKTLPSGSPHWKTRRPFSLKFIIMSAVRETFRFSSPSSSRRTNFAAASSFSSIRMSSPSCASQ